MRAHARPGLVILAVLLVVTASALVALSMITAGAAARGHADASSRHTEAEAIVWSGVLQALAEMSAQRDDLLAGEAPALTGRTELYQTAAGERAVVRLLNVGDADPFDSEPMLARAEAAALNANTASAEMLAALPGLSEEDAQRLISARDAAPFASITEVAARAEITDPDALAYLCVFSADPEVEGGIADAARCGDARIDITAEWSDELAGALDARFGEGSSAAVRSVLDDGWSLASRTDLANFQGSILSQSSEEWREEFDALVFSSEPYAIGRVDMLRASAEVLAAIPGIDEDAARELVSTRDRLSDPERRSISWPTEYGVLSYEDFALAAEHLAARSLQWTIRVEGGFTPAQIDDTLSAAELRDRSAYDSNESLIGAVVWEVVIDASVRPARVASITDVTLEHAWAAIAHEQAADENDSEDDTPAPSVSSSFESADPVGPAQPEPDTKPAARRIGRWMTTGGDA
ncbi:MAG: hypothetical protein DHS20C14_12780 [Phycisphaeraceae bacterium]|nr:MAG: hypothetical protein DHS20C14_12780 [Phycisphaeraceae bacterium]